MRAPHCQQISHNSRSFSDGNDFVYTDTPSSSHTSLRAVSQYSATTKQTSSQTPPRPGLLVHSPESLAMPPSNPLNCLPTDYRAWTTAAVPSIPSVSGITHTAEYPVPPPQPSSHAQFERRLSSKKDLKGGMTQRWLKEDPRKDARRDVRKALAVLAAGSKEWK